MEIKSFLEEIYPGIEVGNTSEGDSRVVEVSYKGIDCDFKFDSQDTVAMIVDNIATSLNQSLLNNFTEELAKCAEINPADLGYWLDEEERIHIEIFGGEFSAPVENILNQIKEDGIEEAASTNHKYLCYEVFGVGSSALSKEKEVNLAKTCISYIPTGDFVFKDGILGYNRVLNLLSEMGLSSKSLVTAISRVGDVTGFSGRCAKFEKVSKEQFENDEGSGYETLQLPKRATSGSAGYDFFAPFDFKLAPGESMVIPTGIRCCMLDNYVLQCYPRSGHGFKYLVRLANTVGIIDSDYYNSKNEGHIKIKLVNTGDKTLEVKAGEAFCQGIFTQFGLTIDDDADGVRDGGFGSTSK